MASAKMGRPPLPKAKRKQATITVRVSAAEMRTLEAAEMRADAKLSTWARNTLLAAATRAT